MTDQNDMLKGNTLALEAIAEQLQKSNDLSAVLAARFAKEDEKKSEEEMKRLRLLPKLRLLKKL